MKEKGENRKLKYDQLCSSFSFLEKWERPASNESLRTSCLCPCQTQQVLNVLLGSRGRNQIKSPTKPELITITYIHKIVCIARFILIFI